MQERNISRKAVIETLQRPDTTKTQSSSRHQALKLFHRGRIPYVRVVVYEEDRRKGKVVITAFVTSKIEKYLS